MTCRCGHGCVPEPPIDTSGWEVILTSEEVERLRRERDEAMAEAARLREALVVLDSGAHAPDEGPEAWQEYAMYVQVVTGGALGTVGL